MYLQPHQFPKHHSSPIPRINNRKTKKNKRMNYQQPAASEETPSSTSNPSGRVEYLMLGFASSRSESHLIQIRIPNLPANDADFFRFLATQHKTHRRNWHGIPRFWKFVSGIYFVKFRTRAPSASCDVIRVVGVDNLPNADERGWTRKINRVPPPGPQMMLNYVEYPRRHERSRRIFLQVPRKLDSAIPSRAGEVGWGLYYFERTRWTFSTFPSLLCGSRGRWCFYERSWIRGEIWRLRRRACRMRCTRRRRLPRQTSRGRFRSSLLSLSVGMFSMFFGSWIWSWVMRRRSWYYRSSRIALVMIEVVVQYQLGIHT
jgi:hypothetical protein